MRTNRDRQPRRILGIDPGSRWIGWGVVDDGQPIYWGTIDCQEARASRWSLNARVRAEISRLLRDFRPDVVAVESPCNLNTPRMRPFRIALKEIARTIRRARIESHWIPPSRARQMVCGDGWATKEVVARELARTFPCTRTWFVPRSSSQAERYAHHASDAICAGLATSLIIVRSNSYTSHSEARP